MQLNWHQMKISWRSKAIWVVVPTHIMFSSARIVECEEWSKIYYQNFDRGPNWQPPRHPKLVCVRRWWWMRNSRWSQRESTLHEPPQPERQLPQKPTTPEPAGFLWIPYLQHLSIDFVKGCRTLLCLLRYSTILCSSQTKHLDIIFQLADSTNPSKNCLLQYYSKIKDLDFVSEAQLRGDLFIQEGESTGQCPGEEVQARLRTMLVQGFQIRGDLYMQGIYSVLEGIDQRATAILQFN